MGGSEIEYVKDAFESNWIAPLGPYVNQLEKSVTNIANRKYGVATSSGTAAIHLALKCLNVSKDDLVFCSDFTFAASCNPAVYLGAKPVFIDSEPDTWNMSPLALEKALEWAKSINKLPKAVIIVDLYGISARFDKLIPICQKYNVPVIEDSAESLGAKYLGTPCGSFGVCSVFSFNGNKIVTTSGGGMLLTDSKEIADKSLYLSTQARENKPYYEHTEIGYNYRLSNICAAIGLGQMDILDKKIKRRNEIFNLYAELLSGTETQMMPVSGSPNYWLTVITLNHKDPSKTINELNKQNIEARYTWKPMHMQPVFSETPAFPHGESFVCENIFMRGICLPSGEALTYEMQKKITDVIKENI